MKKVNNTKEIKEKKPSIFEKFRDWLLMKKEEREERRYERERAKIERDMDYLE